MTQTENPIVRRALVQRHAVKFTGGSGDTSRISQVGIDEIINRPDALALPVNGIDVAFEGPLPRTTETLAQAMAVASAAQGRPVRLLVPPIDEFGSNETFASMFALGVHTLIDAGQSNYEAVVQHWRFARPGAVNRFMLNAYLGIVHVFNRMVDEGAEIAYCAGHDPIIGLAMEAVKPGKGTSLAELEMALFWQYRNNKIGCGLLADNLDKIKLVNAQAFQPTTEQES